MYLKDSLVTVVKKLHRWFFGQEISLEMKKFLKNLSWITSGSITMVAIMFITTLLAGRILGPAEYGKYALIVSMGQIFVLPMIMGLNTSLIKYSASSNNPSREISSSFFLVIIFTLVSASVIYLFRNYIGELFKTSANLVTFGVIYSAILSFNYFMEASLKGLQKFRLISLLNVSNALTVMLVFFVYITITKDYSFRSYIIAISIGLLTYGIVAISKNIPKLKNYQPQVAKKLVRYGLYAVLGGVAGFAFSNVDRLILNSYLGFSSVGIYTVYASAGSFLPSQVQQMFNHVFFPSISSMDDRNKPEVFNKLVKVFKIGFIPFVIANFLLVILIVFLYGKDYQLNYYFAFLFAFANTVFAFQSVFSWLIASYGEKALRANVFISLLSGLINVALVILLTKRFGLIGAVIAFLVSSSLLVFLFTRYLRVYCFSKKR